MSCLNEKIRTLRRAKGLTQQELATRAQVGLATIQNIEAGRANPELSTLESILGIFGFELELKSRMLDWSTLTLLGVPLMTGSTIEGFRVTARYMIETLNQSTGSLLEMDSKSRECAAVSSFLRALQDHYPSLWQHLDADLVAWLKKNSKFASIKLRRLALQRLGEYL